MPRQVTTVLLLVYLNHCKTLKERRLYSLSRLESTSPGMDPSRLNPVSVRMNGARRFGYPLLMRFWGYPEKLTCCLAE